MKIRNGFVSNSSSSSFILCGNEIDVDNVDIDNKDIFIAIGPMVNEGFDLIRIDSYLKLGMVIEKKDLFIVYKCDSFDDIDNSEACLYDILGVEYNENDY